MLTPIVSPACSIIAASPSHPPSHSSLSTSNRLIGQIRTLNHHLLLLQLIPPPTIPLMPLPPLRLPHLPTIPHRPTPNAPLRTPLPAHRTRPHLPPPPSPPPPSRPPPASSAPSPPDPAAPRPHAQPGPTPHTRL